MILGTATALAACAPAYKPPPLSVAEKCSENGLIVGSTKGAQASGVVGSFFAGDGSTHSCKRPMTKQQQCEVQANSQSAVTKQTYKAERAQVLAYANQMRWYTYNTCMGIAPPPAGSPPASTATAAK